MTKESDEYTEEEAARRRDEVVRRMANTPPQPRPSATRQSGTKTSSVSGPAARKPADDDGKEP